MNLQDCDSGTDVRRKELEDVELKLLLDGIFEVYGFDFRDYAMSTLKRRIRNFLEAQELETISDLQNKILHDSEIMEKLLLILSVHFTSMYRDPNFYMTFRTKVVPMLKTYPFVRIWHAGCSTGQEVFSMAILLREEGIYEKSRIYATDMNEQVLKGAKDGIFPLSGMQENSRNYIDSGGKREFSDYYTVRYDHARFDPSLLQHVVFAQHNLVTDSGFNEFNVIVCRNVLIYFNRALQNRVHKVFYENLCYLGCLCLGTRETVDFTPHELDYRQVELNEKIYQKIHATTL